MNSELIKTKAKEIQKELETCIEFYKAGKTSLAKSWDDFTIEKLFFEEILRVLSYLDSKETLSELTLTATVELLNDIFPNVKWKVEDLKSNLKEYAKKHPDYASEFDTEIFSLPQILEVAKEFDSFYATDKFDKVSIFLFQIFNLLIKSDNKITFEEEKFLFRYNSGVNKSKLAPMLNDTEFAKQISNVYEDFFGYSQKLEKEIKGNREKKEAKPEEPKTEEKPPEKEKTLEELLAELNGLIGLGKVKAELDNLINVIKVEKIRKEKGLGVPDKSLHLVFTGNPGTGKTTVARILAKIYKALGVLTKGHLIEIDRAGLVAGFVGQTAIKTAEVCKSALDGVLFIDEAYALAEGGENDFGKEAINTLLKFMEDNRTRVIVIVAGYTHNMEQFISKNPGLMSRFNKYIQFDDYSPEELLLIFEKISKGMKLNLTEDARSKVLGIFVDEYAKRNDKFGNGRFARNLFEKVYMKQANRLVKVSELTEEILCTILPEDIE